MSKTGKELLNTAPSQETLRGLEAPLGSLLSELKVRLSELYGDRLSRLVVYGSYAKGAARQGSDLDVAMVLDGCRRPWVEIDRTGPLVADLSLKYGVTVSLVPIRKLDWERNGTLLARSLHREGILVG